MKTDNTDIAKKNELRFMDAVHGYIGNRLGIKALTHELMDKTDFFIAPASTHFHGSYAGGLCEHSLNVLHNMLHFINDPHFDDVCQRIDKKSAALVALFHDICKANYYTIEMRNRKNEKTGRWEKVPFYTVADQFPAGHGEKSVIILQRYLELTDDEIMAINWHMGFSDIRTHEFSGMNQLNLAFEKYPLALLLHMADVTATYFDEKMKE